MVMAAAKSKALEFRSMNQTILRRGFFSKSTSHNDSQQKAAATAFDGAMPSMTKGGIREFRTSPTTDILQVVKGSSPPRLRLH
jgi:hypothetical protein